MLTAGGEAAEAVGVLGVSGEEWSVVSSRGAFGERGSGHAAAIADRSFATLRMTAWGGDRGSGRAWG